MLRSAPPPASRQRGRSFQTLSSSDEELRLLTRLLGNPLPQHHHPHWVAVRLQTGPPLTQAPPTPSNPLSRAPNWSSHILTGDLKPVSRFIIIIIIIVIIIIIIVIIILLIESTNLQLVSFHLIHCWVTKQRFTADIMARCESLPPGKMRGSRRCFKFISLFFPPSTLWDLDGAKIASK